MKKVIAINPAKKITDKMRKSRRATIHCLCVKNDNNIAKKITEYIDKKKYKRYFGYYPSEVKKIIKYNVQTIDNFSIDYSKMFIGLAFVLFINFIAPVSLLFEAGFLGLFINLRGDSGRAVGFWNDKTNEIVIDNENKYGSHRALINASKNKLGDRYGIKEPWRPFYFLRRDRGLDFYAESGEFGNRSVGEKRKGLIQALIDLFGGNHKDVNWE